MSIKFVILGFLSWKPLTGYDLKKMFSESVALYWSGNNNQIYRVLVELHDEGLVTREIQNQENLPPRKIYSITERGIAELKKWILTVPELPELRHSFLLQLSWGDQLNSGELDALLTKYEDEVYMQLLMIQAKDQFLNASLARTAREACLWAALQDYWVDYYKHELAWVRQLRTDLAEIERE